MTTDQGEQRSLGAAKLAEEPGLAGGLRVCHLCGTSVGGHYFRDMARGLGEEGVSCLYVTLPGSPPPPWLRDLPRVGYGSLDARSRWGYPAAIARLARILRANRIDVLQTHLVDAAMVGLAAGRLARTPLMIVTRHHLDQHQLLKRPVHVEIDRMTARLADRVIVPAAAVRDHMVAVERVAPGRIEVIHHGLDADAFAASPGAERQIREEFGLDGAFVMGYVGWLDPAKGVTSVLAAAGALRSRIGPLRVLVLGDHPDPMVRQAVAREIERRGLGGEVVLAGYRPDVAACMQAMDVLVHPSRSEALPQVLIEAMAVGTPVVATSVGGIPEIVDAGRTGVLVAPGDTEALAAAIERLFRDRELRHRYARASVARARSHFAASEMVQRHLACYRRWLVAKSQSSPNRRV